MNRKSPMVSVIIPCYNQGKYIEKTIQSVLASTYPNFEIIVINDGSTDFLTNEIFNTNSWPKTRIINTKNVGVAEARNIAIKHSTGKYILPLDGDDKISSGYLKDAVEILDNNPNIKVVSCEVRFFGNKFGVYNLPDYSLENLLRQNILVVSSFFRRDDFDKTIGYNPNMIYGHEDWDFWLSLLESGGDVHKIPKVHFYYRIRKKSRNRSMEDEHYKFLQNQIFENHKELYLKHFINPRLTIEYSMVYRLKKYCLDKILHSPFKYFRFLK
jgi:glycosyltransferase involved in cell wall biosynthesis